MYRRKAENCSPAILESKAKFSKKSLNLRVNAAEPVQPTGPVQPTAPVQPTGPVQPTEQVQNAIRHSEPLDVILTTPCFPPKDQIVFPVNSSDALFDAVFNDTSSTCNGSVSFGVNDQFISTNASNLKTSQCQKQTPLMTKSLNVIGSKNVMNLSSAMPTTANTHLNNLLSFRK